MKSYVEIIRALFKEFAVKDSEKSIPTNDRGDIIVIAPLLGSKNLWLAHRSRKHDEHYGKLEVVWSKGYAGSDNDTPCFHITTVAYAREKGEKKKKCIWLDYHGWCNRDFDPTIEGAEEILAIHIRMQELIRPIWLKEKSNELDEEKAKIVEIVEFAAKQRGDPTVPRDFITEALARIEEGKEEVERYAMGMPCMREVYRVASRLYAECTRGQ